MWAGRRIERGVDPRKVTKREHEKKQHEKEEKRVVGGGLKDGQKERGRQGDRDPTR